MWRPERIAALTVLVAACVLTIFACPSTREPAIPPGTALVETPTTPPDPIVDASTVEASVATRFAIRRVEQCVVPPVPAEDGGTIAVDFDVAYGADERQVIDIAWPKVPSKGLVVIVHGGGWTAGAKKLFVPTIRQLASIGYVASTVNYRLARSTDNAFPVGLVDVRCAIREAQAQAVSHKIDASKVVVIGASAGGHLAAMVAVDGDDPSLDGACSRKGPIQIRGAIAYYAPLELDRAHDHYPPKMVQAVDEFLRVDGGPSDWDRKARRATPNHYVDPQDAPVLLLHGSDDRIVPASDSHAFAHLLEAAGVPALVVEVPQQDHGFAVFGKKESIRAATCTALAFLEDAFR
jgi:acetyl esterase/lipase